MENNFQIPSDFQHLTELPNLLRNILTHLDVDRILISDLQQEGYGNLYLVTTFVNVSIESIPKEVLTIFSNIDQEFPNFRVMVYTEEQAEVAMKRGSLYFVEHCCFGTSLYCDPKGQNFFERFDLSYQPLIKRTMRYYSIEMKKIETFSKAAEEFIKGKDYNLASFNLHQAFGLGFRLIEHLCLGKSKLTQSILSHVKYCHPFFSQLTNILEAPNWENKDLLVLLEHAYTVARHENEFDINYEQIKELLAKLELFLNEIEAIYENRLSHTQERINQSQDIVDHASTLPDVTKVHCETAETEDVDKVLEDAVAQIKRKMNPTHIYLMGKREMLIYDQSSIHDHSGCEMLPTQYWLCCISESEQVRVSSEIVDYIQQKHSDISLCLCSISLKSFSVLFAKRNLFTTGIISDGKLLFKAQEAKHFNSDNKLPKFNDKKIPRIFGSRYFRALYLLESAKSMDEAPIVGLSTISMAIEQICLGLIYAQWNYQPSNYSLSHLIKLCSLFYPDILYNFPLETELDKDLFKILKMSRKQLRVLKLDQSIDKTKVDILMLRTKGFLEDSRNFVHMVYQA